MFNSRVLTSELYRQRNMIHFLVILICTTTFADESVKYAAIIFRHGDRVPVEPYPNDPWRNESFWPVKFGELTNNGKRQQYAFGKLLRQRYSHLLSRDFDPTEIYIQSTDVDRTLMSAQANLAGLYPPYDKTVWNSDLMWQPIPVHTMPVAEDELLAMEKPCPAYHKELERYKNSKDYKEKLSKYQSLMFYLTRYTGKLIKNYDDIINLYSTLYIETLYNFTLPDWTHSVYPDKMREPACHRALDTKIIIYGKQNLPKGLRSLIIRHDNKHTKYAKNFVSFTVDTGTPLLARLKVGPLLKHINKHMTNAITNADGKYQKVQLYSAHDLTVGNMLNALGMYDGNCPCYTSAVFIELIIDNSTSGHYVRISYRNTTEVVAPNVLNIPDCGTKCPVNKFTKLYDNLISVNWEYECNKQFPPLLAASFIIGLCIFASIYIAHKIHFARVYRRKRENLVYVNIMTAPVTNKIDNV